MEFVIENEYLKVTVTTWGAQVKSVVRKIDGVEHIWRADPAVWGCHAPILFPSAGRVKDDKITVGGKEYGPFHSHGFARRKEHSPVFCGENTITLELTEDEETMESWPFSFRLVSTFTLERDTLHHTLTVENYSEEQISFGIGFHPAFTIPFDENHQVEDYELRFDKTESPLCFGQTEGLINDRHYYLGKNIRTVEIDDHLFDEGSHCMTGLSSHTLGLYEKDTGRGVVCRIDNFPYVLIWSKSGKPHFICIEPWNSLPSFADSSTAWEEKPAAAVLAPGDHWSTTLSTTFIR